MQKSVQARKNRIISAMSGQFQPELPIFKTNRNTNRDFWRSCYGLVISNQGKHYKVHRLDNVGGFVTLAKTPSDNRSGLNISRYIIQLIEA